MTSPHRRTRPLCGLALLVLLCVGTPVSAELVARQLTLQNVDRLQPSGPDAIAGVGDWVIGNGTLCAAISDPSHESVLSSRGGVLVDLGFCGRGDDQWGVLQPMLNLSRDNVLPVLDIRAETSPQIASIVTNGELNGVVFETRYSVDLAERRKLRIHTSVERLQPGEPIFLFGDVSLHGHRQLTPFTISTRQPEASPGFQHPPIDLDDYVVLAGAMVAGDLQILVGGDQLEPGISYGWQLEHAQIEMPDGTREDLPYLGMNGEHFSLMGVFTNSLWLDAGGDPGLLELSQTVLMDIEVGQRITYERAMILGERADVASVTNQIWREGPLYVGDVDDPTTRLDVRRADGTPVTQVRPRADGSFSFRLPPGTLGSHIVIARTPDGRSAARILEPDPTLGGNGQPHALGTLRTAPPAMLSLPDLGPVQLVFKGVPPTPDPSFGDDVLDYRVGEHSIPPTTAANRISLVGAPDEPRHLRLRPGRYRVYATRGPEFSVGRAEVVLRPGGMTPLEIQAPIRLLEHPGWLSADLHVHSAESDDSAYPLRRRVASFAAQSADVIVATEHDRIVDYGPMIRRLGLAEQMQSVVGVEVTSTVKGSSTPFTIGHANAFPLRRAARQYRSGAPRGEDVRLRDLAAELRQRRPRALLQLNHPREGGFDSGLGGYFTHLAVSGRGHDPTLPLDQAPNDVLIDRDPETGLRDLDFDAVELLNGPSMLRYRLTRADWLAFLLQGERRTATGNSDSHGASVVVALPRNYVAHSQASDGGFDEPAFMRAIQAGRVYVSTGPLLEVDLAGSGPGQQVSTRAGELRIEVRAAPWVPVSEARVYVNGALHESLALRGPGRASLPMEFEHDAFVTVEVEGPREGEAAETYSVLAPGYTPFAFTNPIFVDADGDGRWNAPGLPEPRPPTLTDPASRP